MNLVDDILKTRELKNEKRVAWIRFLALCPMSIIDILAYYDIVVLTGKPASFLTITLDLFFLLSGTIVLVLLLFDKFSKYLTYFIIFFDYSFVLLSILFDPSVSKEKYSIGWVALVGPIFFFIINLLRYSKRATILAGSLSILVFLICIFYFNVHQQNDIIPMFIAMLIMIGIGYSITSSNKDMMVEANAKKMMERYLPPQLIEELYTNKASLELGGKVQKVSILFSDIRSFTAISESMKPSEIVLFLNDYLSEMTDIIFHNKGTIDKFIGDAIMTVFGAPIQSNDDAYRAVKSAIEMNQSLVHFNNSHPQLKKGLEIGIGIHTGEVITGNIGSDKRLDYTVIGDNVNLSSRIQDLTKYYKCPILISESTVKELPPEIIDKEFIIREVDKVIVKGKTEFVKIFEVLFFKTEIEKDQKLNIKESFQKGLLEYYSGNFQSAIQKFTSIQNDPLSLIYKNRCEKLFLNPPSEDWDGIFRMETK